MKIKPQLALLVIFFLFNICLSADPSTLTQSDKVVSQSQKQEEISEVTSDDGKQLPNKINGINQKLMQKFYCQKSLERQYQNTINDQTENKRERRVKTIYGFQMYIDGYDRTVSQSILVFGTWQPTLVSLIAHLVKPGNKILNIGSQVGLEALVMAKIVGQKGKVYAFEPYGFSYQMLKKSIEINNLGEIIQLFKIGAYDKKSNGSIEVTYQNTGGSIITPTNQVVESIIRQRSEIQPVVLDKVDNYLHHPLSIDFCLIDAETMEAQALLGMQQTIQNSPNLIILIEWNYYRLSQQRKIKASDMIKFLKIKGYKFYRYVDNKASCQIGNLIEISDIVLFRSRATLDLIFAPENRNQFLQNPSKQNLQGEKNVIQTEQLINKQLLSPEKSTEIQIRNNTQIMDIPPLQNFCFDQNKKFTQPLDTSKPQRLQLVQTRYNFKMYVDKNDGSVSMKIRKYGTWQPGLAALVAHFVRPGDITLNLGSQSGMQAIIMGKRTGKNGHLFIFEPYSFSYQMVKKNIQINGLNEITTVYNFGASNQNQQGQIKVQYINTGGSEISEISANSSQNRRYNQVERVVLKRVQQVIPQKYSLNFILMDVQKMEGRAILGMKKIIERSPNLVMMIEWNYPDLTTDNERKWAKESMDYLLSLGYTVYQYQQPRNLCEMGTFTYVPPQKFYSFRRYLDLFFFPKSVKIENGKLPQSYFTQSKSPEKSTEIQIRNNTQSVTFNDFKCVPSATWSQKYKSKNTQSNQRHQLVNTRYGFDMYIDSKDKTVSASIFNKGTWQPKYISLIAHLINPGDKILNLGSQSGLEAIIMGKIIGQTGHLYIFEPYQISYEIVSKNIELNGLQRYSSVYQYGASDHEGKGFIGINYGNTGGSQIKTSKPSGRYDQKLEISLKKVDDVLPHLQLNFALIDVQKMQPYALLGMQRIISQSPNLIMMIQWNYAILDDQSKQKAKKAIQMLQKNNFEFFVYYYQQRCQIGRFSQISSLMVTTLHRVIDIFVFPSSMKAPYLNRLQQTVVDNQSNQNPENSQNQQQQKQQYIDIQSLQNLGIQQINVPYQRVPPQFDYRCMQTKSFNSSTYVDKSQDSPRLQKVATRYGFEMYIDKNDGTVSRSIAKVGTWEPKTISLIGFLIQQNDTVLNLGSQSGLQAIIMGSIIGQNGHMFIFQPYSLSNKMVTSNILLNGLKDRTKIYKIGASDHNDTAKIRVKYSNTGGSIIVPKDHTESRDKLFNEVQEVYLMKVDDILPKQTQLDFALIDVQKLEGRAITGMKQIIERSPNLIIYVEWNYPLLSSEQKKISSQLISFLNEKGYRYYRYMSSSTGCKIGKFVQYNQKQLMRQSAAIDLLMYPKDLPFPTNQNSPKQMKYLLKNLKNDNSDLDQNTYNPQPSINQYCYANLKIGWGQSMKIDRSQVAPRQQLIQTIYDFKLYIDKQDTTVSQYIYTRGTWQPSNINIIIKLIKPGDNIINIGSHIGLQAVIMGKIIGKDGKMFVFEPYAFSNKLLKMNIQLNALQDITTIYEKAASNQTGNAQLQIDYYNTGGSRINIKKIESQRKHSEIQQVQLQRADTLLPQNVSYNFALIDVQRMEVEVLQGMKSIFQNSPQLIIIVQWNFVLNQNKDEKRTMKLLEYLQEKGYSFYIYNGSQNTCQTGDFVLITKKQLLKSRVKDIFMFPKSVPLPH